MLGQKKTASVNRDSGSLAARKSKEKKYSQNHSSILSDRRGGKAESSEMGTEKIKNSRTEKASLMWTGTWRGAPEVNFQGVIEGRGLCFGKET